MSQYQENISQFKTFPMLKRVVGQSHNIKIDNISFARVEEFKYLGTTLINQHSIQEGIKSRLKSGNVCYHSVHNIVTCILLFKNLKIKIYKTITLPIVLYGCETWSLTLREMRRLRVFGNRVLRKIVEWRKLHNEELNDLYCSPNIVRVIKSRM
jgi:hypothetical protein